MSSLSDADDIDQQVKLYMLHIKADNEWVAVWSKSRKLVRMPVKCSQQGLQHGTMMMQPITEVFRYIYIYIERECVCVCLHIPVRFWFSNTSCLHSGAFSDLH